MVKFSYETYQEYVDLFLSKLKEALAEELLSVALFGSIARGEGTPDSDIDLLIIVKGNRVQNFKKYIKIKMECEKDSPPYFSSIFTTEENLRKKPLILLDILHEGKILYDPSNVLQHLLNKMSNRLKELGAERRALDKNTWLWDLKPDWKLGEVVNIEL